MKQNIIKTLFAVFVVMTIVSCVADKKTGRLTKFGKFYHNVTGHYNYFFNAREIIETSTEKLAVAHKDNYNKVLEMYREAAIESATSENPRFDDAIKRGKVNAELHPKSDWADDTYLEIGMAQYLKKDYADAEGTFQYIVSQFDPKKLALEDKESRRKAAKSDAAKKDDAKKGDAKKEAKKSSKKSTKKKTVQRFTPKTDPKKDVKKEDPKSDSKKTATKKQDTLRSIVFHEIGGDKLMRNENGKKIKRRTYFLKHRPVREDAFLWLARTYIEQQRFDEAESLLRTLGNDYTLPQKLWKQLPEILAYSKLRQKDYTKAAENLEETIKRNKNVKKRTRYTYILAQIYDLQKESDKAYTCYKKVLKLDPDFDMEFNAKLNLANNAFATGKMTTPEVVALLKKMLKEVRYEDHYDQIYFTLGKISMTNGEEAQGIAYYKKSILANKTDKNQKAEAYYAIAEYYWKKERFAIAKHYYDSTATVLAKTDDRYDLVSRRAIELTEIAKNIEIVEINDSLLRMAAMPDAERNELGKKIIEKRRETEKADAIKSAIEKANSDAEGRSDASTVAAVKNGAAAKSLSAINLDGTATTGAWWAYNEASRKKGQRDFERKWGKRKRTDDWRRLQRKDSDISTPEDSAAVAATTPNLLTTNPTDASQKDIDALWAGIPKSDKEKEALRFANTEALYKIGDLFRLRMNMPKNSVRAHEDLLSRNPTKNEHEQEIFYTCYLNHSDLKNKPKADYYKGLLNTKFPNSIFTKVVNDPNYLAEQKKKAAVLDTYYEKAFGLYKNDSTLAALAMTMKSDSLFGKDNKLKAKFSLLNAFCRGTMNGRNDYIASLKGVQTKHPNTSESIRAGELLAELENIGRSKAGATKGLGKIGEDQAVDFSYKPEMEHYVVIWIKDEGATDHLPDFRTSATEYNTRFYNIKNLKVAALTPDLQTALLIVRRFDNAEAARQYATNINGKAQEYLGEKDINYNAMPISSENYAALLRTKNTVGYEAFVKKMYK
ncbi:MAG: hypothetical protein RI894_2670 [Bacteroidota bacterium]|jgi:tetratricopeptide (TPR) repeat protein